MQDALDGQAEVADFREDLLEGPARVHHDGFFGDRVAEDGAIAPQRRHRKGFDDHALSLCFYFMASPSISQALSDRAPAWPALYIISTAQYHRSVSSDSPARSWWRSFEARLLLGALFIRLLYLATILDNPYF